MISLELLSPARNKDIGVAAIDCGADAVYIAGPDFGNRKAAGNGFEDIAELCTYAHRYGVRIFLTVNTIVYDDELELVHAQMLEAQEAGVDAFIFRDERLLTFEDIRIPFHASTQCAIRDVERARHFEALGCERIILERELSLEQVRAICEAVSCQVEFFVHGALCVCYSGDCRLSEWIDGRSADRGECIQACRSLYDLVDGSGRTLVRGKALLSLKDYNLKNRLEELAAAGVCSFKIEGRLKNESYVRNIVRDYDLALNDLVAAHPDLYRRASFGHVSGGVTPNACKTFNRGYTELWLDGSRGPWSSMDAPKSMGEEIGTVESVRRVDARSIAFVLRPLHQGLKLSNGDGFAIAAREGVVGFRGDVCEGMTVYCKDIPQLRKGMKVCRNVDTAFEKEIVAKPCRREIAVALIVKIRGRFEIDIEARTEDGRTLVSPFKADLEVAENRERSEAMIREQLSKRSGIYSFGVEAVEVSTQGGVLPLLSASTINSMRRLVADDLDSIPVSMPSARRGTLASEVEAETYTRDRALPLPLMRTKYCIRYELGLCPVHQGAAPTGDLFLLNNGRSLALGFDCSRCEMTVNPAE